jgi:hypothetical protein
LTTEATEADFSPLMDDVLWTEKIKSLHYLEGLGKEFSKRQN